MATFKIDGIKTAMAGFEAMPDKIVIKVSRTGTRKAAAQLRTKIRRAAPKLTGRLRKSINVWSPTITAQRRSKSSGALTRVSLTGVKGGAKLRSAYYYYTLEAGRGPHTRLGHPRAGSPQMRRFAFFHSTVERNSAATLQTIIDATNDAIAFEAGKLHHKTLHGR